MVISANYSPMPDEIWRNFGNEEWVYVKSGTHAKGHTIYNVFKADGTFITTFEDHKLAFTQISQHDVEPLWAH